MADAEKQAQEIYRLAFTTSDFRPTSGHNQQGLLHDIEEFRKQSPAIQATEQASPEVLLVILENAFAWLTEANQEKPYPKFGFLHTLCDVVRIALTRVPRPLSQELLLRLLSRYRQDLSMARFQFPVKVLLDGMTVDELTPEIQLELRKLRPQYAPTTTGKTHEHSREIYDRISDLLIGSGEARPEPGRGPWSQIVYNELRTLDDVSRAGWHSLLEHCVGLQQSVPGAKWKKQSRELCAAIGNETARGAMLRWLAVGPTPGQIAEEQSPIEDSAMQKGVVWCLAQYDDPEVSSAIGKFGIECLRKIKMVGAVSQKVGFACVQALGAMNCSQSVLDLTLIRVKVKYTVARRLIEKSLRAAAERAGLTVAELEDMAVPGFDLDVNGQLEQKIGDVVAVVTLTPDGDTLVVWRKDGKLLKSPPADVKKSFPETVRGLAALAKSLPEVYKAQRARLENSYFVGRAIPYAHWRKHFQEHPLLGFLGRRLIWLFEFPDAEECAALWWNGALRKSDGTELVTESAKSVRLWHPLSASESEIKRWRQRVSECRIRQPFRQAFREFYSPNQSERETKMYSNRFAGVLLRQHQLASLCREREWDYRLMSTSFDGFNVPSKNIAAWNVRAEFYVDLPSDRKQGLHDSALNDQSGTGINLFVGSDQVRFYRDGREIGVDEVPALVFSEIMRDVDLFATVAAVGPDETWEDQGERGTGISSTDLNQYSEVVAMRQELLRTALPHTSIAQRCTISRHALEVQGQLGRYRIMLGWGAAALCTDNEHRWLKIPPSLLRQVKLDLAALPVDLDHRLETMLRTACLLADDWEIRDPELVRQLMPREKS